MKHCCERMTQQVEYKCPQHADPFDCYRVLICYIAEWDEYGIIEHGESGNHVYIKIEFCPFCGVKLPESKSDLWFDKLEAMGVDPQDPDGIPKEFRTDEWYRKGDR